MRAWAGVVALGMFAGAAQAAPSLTVSPTSLSGSGGWVTVTWSGWTNETDKANCFFSVYAIPNPNTSAIPAQAYPATPPWTGTFPAQFVPCTQNASFAQSGATTGSWSVFVVNDKFDASVVLFTGGVNTPVALTAPVVVTMEDQAAYLFGHVTKWYGDAGDVMVGFSSKFNNGSAAVRWGLSASSLPNAVAAEAYTYEASDLCGAPAATFGWHEPGWFYKALLQGLPNDGKTTIFYQFGDDVYGWSSVRNFTALLGPNPMASVGLLVIADMGVTFSNGSQYHWEEPDAYLTVQGCLAHADSHPLMLHVGDVAYATGMEQKWSYYMNAVEELVSHVPVMVGLGNHEQDWDQPESPTYYLSADSGGECGIATAARFPMPTAFPAPTYTPLWWYSFNHGPVHVLMWDSEMPLTPGTEQYAFIQEDLAAVDRTLTPWVIVAGHRPIYTGTTQDPHLSAIEPLLMQYKVDLSLYGHVHNAQVFCPLYNNSGCLSGPHGQYVAPIHAVIGNAGQELSPFPPLDNRTVFSYEGWGFSTIDVNTTNLVLNLYADDTQELIYSTNIFRTYPRSV